MRLIEGRQNIYFSTCELTHEQEKKSLGLMEA
jgi:hypothetical protein